MILDTITGSQMISIVETIVRIGQYPVIEGLELVLKLLDQLDPLHLDRFRLELVIGKNVEYDNQANGCDQRDELDRQDCVAWIQEVAFEELVASLACQRDWNDHQEPEAGTKSPDKEDKYKAKVGWLVVDQGRINLVVAVDGRDEQVEEGNVEKETGVVENEPVET